MATEVPRGMVVASIKCPGCKEIEEFLIPRRGLERRSRGFSPEESFPDLDPARRRQLADHLCTRCRPQT